MSSANLQTNGESVEKILIVENQMGIHARPAAMIVRVSNKYSCEVFFEKDDEQVNGKSIMGLMMLAAGKGSEIKGIAIGDGAEDCLSELDSLFKGKFDEE
ncbi:MAG: HPr family phosphocarrier protein [Verrucomicrobiota bacterium]